MITLCSYYPPVVEDGTILAHTLVNSATATLELYFIDKGYAGGEREEMQAVRVARHPIELRLYPSPTKQRRILLRPLCISRNRASRLGCFSASSLATTLKYT